MRYYERVMGRHGLRCSILVKIVKRSLNFHFSATKKLTKSNFVDEIVTK